MLLRYAEGHDSTGKREEGFLEAMKAHPEMQVISSNQYVGADVEGAYKKTESILSGYKKPDGSLGVDGIFCVNESSTFAAMRVLQDNGWAGKVRFVGFDASANLVKGLEDGVLDGIVLQDPVQMGYLAVKTLVAHIKGEAVEKRIDTGVHVATSDNMDQPEHAGAGPPGPVTQWLKRPHRPRPLFEMRGIRKALRRDDGARRCGSGGRARGDLRARRRERRRQEHADEHPRRRASARRRRDAHRRRALRAAQSRSRRAAPASR